MLWLLKLISSDLVQESIKVLNKYCTESFATSYVVRANKINAKYAHLFETRNNEISNLKD